MQSVAYSCNSEERKNPCESVGRWRRTTGILGASLISPVNRRRKCLIFVHGHATLSCMNWEQRITIDPGKRGGKPCIRGLRITVYDVLEYLASGMSEEDILKDFPDLTREDIRACLTFAADRERKLVSLPPS
jgi:uncharacterized protein (DUF433 family)